MKPGKITLITVMDDGGRQIQLLDNDIKLIRKAIWCYQINQPGKNRKWANGRRVLNKLT